MTIEEIRASNPAFWETLDGFDILSIKEMPGWHQILVDVGKAAPAGAVVAQVKEKFGLLDVYFDARHAADEDVSKFLAFTIQARQRSGCVCQKCGEFGKLRKRGNYWLYTACDEHADE